MRMDAHSEKMRPVHPALKRRSTNISPSRKTLAMLDAFAQFKVSLGEPRPPRTWMIEQGATLFLGKMANRFPEIRQTLKEIDDQFNKMEELIASPKGRGVVRSLVGREKRK